ncbi:Avirulence (Avh) protein [Phytophthora megakarya]|uniref:Avirulence (Avh) protein n=1 Tax=Phytophthora megakarya TaxID=4795 RepID=A0A225WAD6_9STRA|nr:Avirulence (Avh) protein [Phytophthora megakarya]
MVDPEHTRLLRTGKVADDENNQSTDSNMEERGTLSSGQLAFLKTIWPETTSVLNKLDDEVMQVAGNNVLNTKMFKAIAESGESPTSLYKSLGIGGKIHTMDEKNMLDDDNFMFWVKYSEWWGKKAKTVEATDDYYNNLFMALAETGGTPQSLFKKLDLLGKVRNMKEEDMIKDSDYMFWVKFAKWWEKNNENVRN